MYAVPHFRLSPMYIFSTLKNCKPEIPQLPVFLLYIVGFWNVTDGFVHSWDKISYANELPFLTKLSAPALLFSDRHT